MKLIFATSNAHKLEEVQAVLPAHIRLSGLHDLGYYDEIEEYGDTLEENALIKARFIHQKYGQNVFSEDTGLEIKALKGAPGVVTARYAGPQRDNEMNMDLVLSQLVDHKDRTARFRAVIALIMDNKEYLFEGILNGKISHGKKGEHGFGYDPIFIPEDYDQTSAELGSIVKNQISHRTRALQKMLKHVKSIER